MPEPVHGVGEFGDFREFGKIADDDVGATIHKVCETPCAFGVARMNDDVMAGVE
jgi:hypothetical protein